MYDRILIATDGSELAGKGLRHGLALAAALRVPVVVVTVTEPWMPAFDDALALSADPAMQQEYREGCAHSAQRILQDDLAAAQGIQLLQEPAAQEAVEGAEGRGIGTDDAAHAWDSSLDGWSWTGVRFSHKRRACQWMPATTCAVISG